MFILFVSHVALLSVFPLYFTRLQGAALRLHFLTYLGIVLFLGGFLGNAYSLTVANGITVSGGNLCYGAFMMTSVLFVLLERDAFILRHVIRLVVLVDLFNILFSMLASATLSDPTVSNPYDTPAGLFRQSVPLIVLGGILIIVELAVLLVFFEQHKRLPLWTPVQGLAYLGGFVAILCLDGIAFPLIAFGATSEVIAVVFGGLDGKLLTAAAYCVPLLLFMLFWPDRFRTYLVEEVFTWRVLTKGSATLVRELGEKERALRLSESAHAETTERILAFAENTPGVIVQWRMKDEAVVPVYVSAKCVDYWGHDPDRMIADPMLFSEGQGPEFAEQLCRTLRTGMETGRQIVLRLPVRRVDGATFWLELRAQSNRPGSGPRRIDGIFVDISREVEAEAEAHRQTEAAHRAQRLESIGQLTGGVAHDFNNLLAVIMGNLELLEAEIDTPEHRQLTDAGLQAARRGADLTRSLLAFARRTRLKPKTLDLNDVVDHARNWMRRALPATIDIRTSLQPGIWPVQLDATSLESAMLNLIVNARDAMKGKGTLTIETANVELDASLPATPAGDLAPGRYVRLTVQDTGCGIAPDTLERMFEPFYTTKGPGAGSGVGLSMVQGFVEQSNGSVRVQTEEGAGTAFQLWFPAAEVSPAMADVDEADPAAPPPGTVRVLLAEDEDSVRNVFVRMLERAGYEVAAVSTGDAALARFVEDRGFDILVTDMVMPGRLQGEGLARALRRIDPGLRVVFVSGYSEDFTGDGPGLLPGDTRLMKPVPAKDLLNAVARARTPARPEGEA